MAKFIYDYELFSEARRRTAAILDMPIFYPLKTLNITNELFESSINPASIIADQGHGFDVTSEAEIVTAERAIGLSCKCVEQVGVELARRVIFTAPHARFDTLRFAFEYGVRIFVIDSEDAIGKLLFAAESEGVQPSEISVLVRILPKSNIEKPAAIYQMGRKFGTDAPIELANCINDAGMRFVGLSFHVGSQMTGNVMAWRNAAEECSKVLNNIREYGYKRQYSGGEYIRKNILCDFPGISGPVIDIGGGFPTIFNKNASMENLALIAKTLQGIEWPMIAEPGRIIAAWCLDLEADVIGKREILSSQNDDEKRWVYLDAGRFNAMPEAGERQFAVEMYFHNELQEPTNTSFMLAGPTCDGQDVLGSYRLSNKIKAGWKIRFKNVGAYSLSMSSDRYNGMPVPHVRMK